MYDAGIHCVVQLAYEESPAELPRDIALCRVPLVDGQGNDTALLHLAISTVRTVLVQRIPTLVCCGAGLSRSPAIVAMALSEIENRPAAECLARLVEHHAADVSTALWSDLTLLKGAG